MFHPDVLPMIATAAAYLVLFAIVETVRRTTGVSAELTRKGAHVGGGVISLALPMLFDSSWPVLGLTFVFVGVLVCAKRAGWLPSIYGVAGYGVAGYGAAGHSSARPTTGAYLFPVAVAATFVLARGDWLAYAVGVLALTLGDAAAGIVGTRWGRRPFVVWGEPRTLEGSTAAFAATAASTLGVLLVLGPETGQVGLCALQVGLAVALAEAASPRGLDNLTVPLAAFFAFAPNGSSAGAMLVSFAFAAVLALGMIQGRCVTARARPRHQPAWTPGDSGVR